MKRLLLALCLLPTLARAQSVYESYVTNLYQPTLFYYDTETSGTTLTNHGSSGSAYNMTTHNTPTLNQSGVNTARGGAIQWASASSQSASVNKNDTGSGPVDITTSNNRTFECWLFNTGSRFVGLAGATAETGDSNTFFVGASSTSKPVLNIYQTGSTSVRYQGLGATTLSGSTWYLISGTWAGSTHASTIYINGVSDGTSTTDFGGTGPDAVQFIEQGRNIQTSIQYTDGKQQDCAVFPVTSTVVAILDRYNHGVNVGTFSWPFLTKRPDIPNFRDDGWLEKVKSRGYMDGHFTPQAKEPLWLTVGWLPFSTLPPGNVR